jgi:4-amino-4-deoxy-L-arabinose transferase-like glycosyltransferase
MKEFIKKNILVLSVLIFLVLCFVNINVAPLWRDEAFSALVATNDWGKIIEIASKDTQPPLHLFLLNISYLIAGKGEFALRIWSVLGGLLTIIFAYKITGKIFKEEWPKVLIAPFIVFNPILYSYAIEARSYALFTALYLGAIYFALCYGQNKRRRDLLLLFLFSLLGLYTHNLFVVCLFVIFLMLFSIRLKGFVKWKDIKEIVNKTKDIILLGIILLIFYLPWCLTFLNQLNMIASGGFWLQFRYLNSVLEVMAGAFAGDSYYPQNEPIFYIIAVSIVLGVIGVVLGLYKDVKNSKKQVPILFLGCFMPLLIIYLVSFKTPFMYIRYMIFIVPILLILVIKGYGKIKVLTIIFLVSSIIVTCSTLVFKPNMKEGYKDAIAKIQYNESTDVILHKNALPVFGFRYYSDLPSYIYSKPEDIRYFEGKAAIEQKDYWIGDMIKVKRVWILNIWQDSDFEKKIIDLGFVKSSEEKFDGDLYLYLYIR